MYRKLALVLAFVACVSGAPAKESGIFCSICEAATAEILPDLRSNATEHEVWCCAPRATQCPEKGVAKWNRSGCRWRRNWHGLVPDESNIIALALTRRVAATACPHA